MPADIFMVLPDGIGHGKSSKPSDGRTQISRITVTPTWWQAQYRLLTAGLK